jgi:preprotein translocase subunit SecG
MSFVIGILTFFLVLNSGFLILLVLVQLPKKDAGAGMAFGAGTADALFGAGSGNLLTKITGWTAGILLALSLFLGMLQSKVRTESSGSDFTKMVEQKQQQAPVSAPGLQSKPQATPPPATTQLPMQIPMTGTNATLPEATNKAK